jgi:hypothetical protein
MSQELYLPKEIKKCPLQFFKLLGAKTALSHFSILKEFKDLYTQKQRK